jgi:hypothetical protein
VFPFTLPVFVGQRLEDTVQDDSTEDLMSPSLKHFP